MRLTRSANTTTKLCSTTNTAAAELAAAEDAILSSIPRHILELPRPEFNQWKKDNGITFSGAYRTALRNVHRRMLACRYAREARKRGVGGVRYSS